MNDIWYIVNCKNGEVFWHGISCKFEEGHTLDDYHTLDGYMFGRAKEHDPDGAWCCVKGLNSLMECIFKYNKLNYYSEK